MGACINFKAAMAAALRCLLIMAVWTSASAQYVTVETLQGDLPRGSQNITTLGADLMGDSVNLFTGALQFHQTDVSIPGNSTLPVAVGRKHDAGRVTHIEGQFGDWDLDIPHMHGAFVTSWGWVNGARATDRCTRYTQPPLYFQSGAASTNAEEYWQGNQLYVPGVGEQEVLLRSAVNTLAPQDGSTYHLLTQKHWQLRCLPTLLNAAGEGFVAVSPEGTRYHFNWMASRQLPQLINPVSEWVLRREFFLYPTEVVDRFGNWVRYTYDSANPMLLRSIQGSDGRSINIGHILVGGRWRVGSVTDGVRTWTYSYSSTRRLSQVTLPDGSAWRFNLSGLAEEIDLGDGGTCDSVGARPSTVYAGSITHPSGAVGLFKTRYLLHYRQDVTRHCIRKNTLSMAGSYARWPRSTWNQGLVSKSIDGPGLSTLTWQFAYRSSPASWSPCNGCAATRTVTVTDPEMHVTRHLFGSRFRVDEGQLLRKDEGWDAVTSSALRTTAFSYTAPAPGTSFPEPVGVSIMEAYDHLASRLRPLALKTTYQQGATFHWQASSIDYFGRPLVVSRISSLNSGRTESTTYSDHLGKWVLGQVASVVETSTGAEMERTEFHLDSGLPKNKFSFGRLQRSFEFHPDGTAKQAIDPAGRITQFSDYRRGIPQRIDRPDGTVERAEVNALGQIISVSTPTAAGNGIALSSSVDNEAAATTRYSYDAMGRLAGISYPAGDTVLWNATTLQFVPVSSDEFGLGPGHWRQTIRTGAGVVENYFDGLWRKRISRTYDSLQSAATEKIQVFHYDSGNKRTFESYPVRGWLGPLGSSMDGVSTTFDALGRETSVTMSSELGPIQRRTDYLANFKTSRSDFRGNLVVTGFQAFDDPNEAALASMVAPQGLNVLIDRDIFGKPLAITRSGSNDGHTSSLTRRYVYDGFHRLCKTIEPELGAIVQDYDDANNVNRRSGGTQLTSLTCDRDQVPPAQWVHFMFDEMNRPIQTVFGDGGPGISRRHFPDGSPSQVRSGDNTWNYAYNLVRLPVSEQLTQLGMVLKIVWNYDANRHLTSITYPDLSTVRFQPNAVGQPTRVEPYATNVLFHPNGAVKSFTYGNGIAHEQGLNLRGLPASIRDVGVSNDAYTYDADGNTTAITDFQSGRLSRTMAYDGLSRLKSTSAAQLWGTAEFTYDVLDNLRTSMRGAVHSYDANNRLVGVLGDGLNLAYGHDANGNVNRRGSESFAFDLGNRLTSSSGSQLADGVTSANGWATYSYDGHGRRVREVRSDGLSRTHAYSRAGQLLYSLSTGGLLGNSNTKYIYLGQRLIAEVDSAAGVRYAHTDALGSPTARSDSARTVTSTTTFSPYGRVAAGTNPGAPNSIGFTGHVNEQQTGLVYMQQRYYDPIAGRFLSVDPVTTDAKTGGHFNRYAYADNNPHKYTDPDGRSPVHAALKALDLAVSAIDIMSAFHTGGAGAGLRATLETVLAPPGSRLVAKVADKVGDAAKAVQHFSGAAKPWTKGATPNSIYTHVDPKTGKAVQNAVYDSNGKVVGHVDFKNHGPGAPSGHGHLMTEPGNPASGHGAGKPHIPNADLPAGWDKLPPKVEPHTKIGN